MTKITLHGFAPSTYTRTARMAAIEKGVRHELMPIKYGEPEHFALHPFGKMPVLTDGEVTVFETLAILTYLDAARGEPILFGTTLRERVDILAAISAAIDYAYRALVQVELAEDGIRADQRAAAGQVFDWLESRLAVTSHIASARLSAADLFFAPMMAHHLAKIDAQAPFENRVRLKAWMDTLGTRPSFRETGEH